MPDSKMGGRLGVVTGGAGPLGWSLVTALARAGAHVIAIDLPDRIDSLVLEDSPQLLSRIENWACDLTSRQQFEVLVEKLRSRTTDTGLDFLVNNAAYTGTSGMIGYACAIDEQSDDAFDAAVELNLAVPFRLTRRLLPALRQSGKSSVLNVASIYGLVGPDIRLYEGTSMGNPAAYAASKGGLIQLSRYLATVLAPDIRVNCLAPGGIERGQPEEFVRRYAAKTPLGRMGREEDMIGAAMWLIGDLSAYVTGQVIAVDGGWTAW